eukprot:jgi/Mesen1/10957/ME000096S10533
MFEPQRLMRMLKEVTGGAQPSEKSGLSKHTSQTERHHSASPPAPSPKPAKEGGKDGKQQKGPGGKGKGPNNISGGNRTREGEHEHHHSPPRTNHTHGQGGNGTQHHHFGPPGKNHTGSGNGTEHHHYAPPGENRTRGGNGTEQHDHFGPPGKNHTQEEGEQHHHRNRTGKAAPGGNSPPRSVRHVPPPAGKPASQDKAAEVISDIGGIPLQRLAAATGDAASQDGVAAWIAPWVQQLDTTNHHGMYFAMSRRPEAHAPVSRLQSLLPNPVSRSFRSQANAFDAYFIQITLGSRRQTFWVQLDTGTDIMWVSCDCIDCGVGGLYPQAAPASVPFNTRQSNTAQQLPCYQATCNKTPGFGCNIYNKTSTNCEYKFTYADSSTSIGDAISDNMYFTFRNGAKTRTRVVFGCGRQQSGLLGGTITQTPDGVMGLGRGSLSVVSQISAQKLVPDSFGMCLEGDPRASFYWVQVLGIAVNGVRVRLQSKVFPLPAPDSSQGVLFDSGSTVTVLPEKAYLAFRNAVLTQVPGLQPVTGPWLPHYLECYTTPFSVEKASYVINKFPLVWLLVNKNQKFFLSPLSYLTVPVPSKNAVCFAAIPSKTYLTVIGASWLRNKYILYDRSSHSIAWTDMNCTTGAAMDFKYKGEKPPALPLLQSIADVAEPPPPPPASALPPPAVPAPVAANPPPLVAAASPGCPPKPLDECAFFFREHRYSVPTFHLESGGNGDHALSTVIQFNRSSKVTTIGTANSGDAEFICNEELGNTMGTDKASGQFYINGPRVWMRTIQSSPGYSYYENRYVKLYFTNVQLAMAGAIFNLNKGDGNLDFPDSRRCVVFKTAI